MKALDMKIPYDHKERPSREYPWGVQIFYWKQFGILFKYLNEWATIFAFGRCYHIPASFIKKHQDQQQNKLYMEGLFNSNSID